MIKRQTGIVDIPITRSEEDQLNMHSFEKALTGFIRFTDTPMTIAIQGEWGSGKTSLMNRLSEQLCMPEGATFYSIWLNTWHFALVEHPETTLADIINTLIDEVVKISRKEHPEKMKRLIRDVTEVSKNVFRGLSHVALKTVVPQLSDDAIKEFDSAVFTEKEEKKYNLNDLRNKLNDLISEIILKNREKGNARDTFLFFIDDLDRIEPSVAVKILELLKNIFDIRHCIFILAIDYDVVVSGLKPKFGELTESNEREFRSFFDKIIQLPFRMPVQSFFINDFLKETLLSIDFITKEESLDDELIKSLAEFARSSLGSNPRSLKRLANSLSFINLLMHSGPTHTTQSSPVTPVEKQISFAVVCLQIAFPPVYNLLADQADFQNWREEFAQKHRADKSVVKDASAIQQYGMLTAEWQRIIFATCAKSPYLSRHTYNIIRILDQMKQIAEEQNLHAGDLISDVFEFSSITNVKAALKPTLEINPVRVYFTLNSKLLPLLQQKLKPPMLSVERKGRIIARLPYLFQEKDAGSRVIITLPVKQSNLAVKVGFVSDLFSSDAASEDGWKLLELRGKTEYFRELWSGLIDLADKYPAFHQLTRLQSGVVVKKGVLSAECYFQTYVESVDILYTHKFLETLSDFITDLALLSFRFSKGDWSPA